MITPSIPIWVAMGPFMIMAPWILAVAVIGLLKLFVFGS